jgi:hypothetical protein
MLTNVKENMMTRGEELANHYANGSPRVQSSVIADTSVSPSLAVATMVNLPSKFHGEFARKVIENDIKR